ncbi:undecaprenyl-diphosphatase UppP [Candidatus Nomurabacteria bacterium RIFCSPHIGHO2_02_FULL_38_15]|uniref:Undecaprenyl-diphosphatase n=1 Tax=Candidatus Nomurabacteria bacterium RIFCSPHIGHO2_02_FULL_38_15 TaxID=1801752 RepID=A0A1F6VSW2_9BACT|nr:MAG: undecaprenyl-diphosphatase UppP [Candidatus Nomurabacteria bacterium RIFCSPHIGHO2_02_FULL_38_15]
MTILHAIILGIVEGLTEFLPISSTGHLILTANLLNLQPNQFLKSFEIIIQLGAILAVVFLYIKRILNNKSIFINLIYAFVPTAIIGFLFYKQIKIFLGHNIIVPIALILGGIIIIIVENNLAKKSINLHSNANLNKSVNKTESFMLGIIQTLAFIPGVSRSGAVIIGGLMRGLNRQDLVEFSFMLAIPTMLAATGYDLVKTGFSFSSNEWLLVLTGFITAFIVALLAIKSFLKFITTHSFTSFGWYRIIIGIVFLFILL